jgi:hypothetical protein
MLRTLSLLAILYGLLSTGAQRNAAGEESDLPYVEDYRTSPGVFLVSKAERKACPRVGTACFTSDGGNTMVGIDVHPVVGIVTTIGRGTQVAGQALAFDANAPERWRVEMVARLRERTSHGPITVAAMDFEDPEGMARKEAIAVWTVEDSSPVKDLGMHFVFSSEDGFRAKHAYLLRVVQGTGDDERVLAEWKFELR